MLISGTADIFPSVISLCTYSENSVRVYVVNLDIQVSNIGSISVCIVCTGSGWGGDDARFVVTTARCDSGCVPARYSLCIGMLSELRVL